MIFCFSGTGNSLHVAEMIAEEIQEQIIMITEIQRQQKKKYTLKEHEKIGFIFPIYWCGMPVLVEEFIRDLMLVNYKGNYTYGVATFGQVAYNGMFDLEKLLQIKGIVLQAKYEVKMVDNYVIGYEVINKEKQKLILAEADKKTIRIIDSIKRQEEVKIKDLLGHVVKPIVHHFYKIKKHQDKFYVTDTCVGCRICEEQCPCNVIKLKDEKPVWEENCSFCLKCINYCPKKVIQYGKGTVKRSRYYYTNMNER